MNDKIIEILNQDERSRKMLELFEDKAKTEGLQGKEYQEARKTMLMIIISKNEKAFNEMATEVYNELTA